MRSLLLITLLAAVGPGLSAQRLGSSPHFAPGKLEARRLGGRLGANGDRFAGSNFARSGQFGYGGYGGAFLYPFADPLFADYLYDQGYPVASQPPIIVMQAPPAADPTAAQPSSQVQPLMIEWQGDRYVRVSAEDASGPEAMTPEQSRPGKLSYVQPRLPLAQEVTPAILVFRDGHREEASDYTIAGGVLYARSTDYTTGSWTKSINLSSLDLNQTVASNQSRGVPFRLPSAPNEVMVGP